MRQFWHGSIDLTSERFINFFLSTQRKAAILMEVGHKFLLTRLLLLYLNLRLAKETFRVSLKTNLFFIQIGSMRSNTGRCVRTE